MSQLLHFSSHASLGALATKELQLISNLLLWNQNRVISMLFAAGSLEQRGGLGINR